MKALPTLLYMTLAGTAGVAGTAVAQTQSTASMGSVTSVATRVATLNALLDEQWQHTLRNAPEFATTLGDLRYNDRWSDLSPAHLAAEQLVNADFLRRFEAIDITGLTDTDRLNQQLMVRQLQDALRAHELKLDEMPLEQMSGVHLALAGFVSSIPFDSGKDYDDYVKRLRAVPKTLDQATALARQGLANGMLPPKYLLQKVALQIESIAGPSGMDSVFAEPLKHFPGAISVADRARLQAAVLAAIEHDVRPAYRRLGEFVGEEYAPHGRDEYGIWALPNGDVLYRFAVHQQTTSEKTPAEIHAIGLAEIARIEGEMLNIAKVRGFADLARFRASLAKDPAMRAKSREDILDRYRGYIAGMQPELPKHFGLLPGTRVLVVPVERFREREAGSAEYHQGTPDGSRPGMIFVNTGGFAQRSILSIESTAYHEGVPGHHLQIAVAQTLPGLPPFRQQAGYNAYIEGWALYAEQLGKDAGFYRDPLSDYGRLSDELLRAARLVLDTGVHYKHWTRQQMVDYFHAHTGEDEPDVQAETDRYITWPGQALGYKLGELKILELRARAREALGAKFDIRAFHDQILGGGALPLDVLDQRVQAWIAAVKANRAAPSTGGEG
ncbi:MAG TPA: DUF885 family protein [Rhodanobacteraceae bacterium]|nr:DUF885 family protein [Rhodanobacteraceae bacterium]